MAFFRSNYFISIFLTLLALGCSSTSIHPPFDTPIEELATDTDTNAHWAFLYRSGEELLKSKQSDFGCKYFSELAEDIAFPLHTWAQLKKVVSCRDKDLALKFWRESGEKLPRWAREYYHRQSYVLAKELGLKEEQAAFAYELADYQAPKSEKLLLINEAINLASSAQKDTYLKKLLKISPSAYLNNPKHFEHLYKSTPRNKKKIPLDLLFDIAQEFDRERQFANSRNYYQQIIDEQTMAPSLRHDAWKKKCLSYKLERNRTDYLSCFELHLSKATSLALTESEIIQLKISYARALWTENRVVESRELLNKLLAQKENSGQLKVRTHQALAGIELEEKKYQEAIGQLQQAQLELKSSHTEESDQLFWRMGFFYYLLKDYQSALNYWQSLAEKALSPSLKIQAKFWSGQCFKKINQGNKAEDYFTSVAKDDSFGYYGILAQRELGKEFSTLTDLKAEVSAPENIPTSLEWLLYLKEEQLANRYLRFFSYGLQNEKEVEKALPLFHYAKSYDLSILVFFKIPAEKRNQALERYAAYIYPIPYAEEITANATRFAIPAEYILAIIRQESAFNTMARSPADAFGLMQVIPERAFELASELSIEYQNFDDLYRPEVNLPIGSYLLSKNLLQYHGSYVAASAAYNAGDTPVKRWYQDRYRGDILEFIESIPYEETQTYVKLILRNMVNYMRFTHGRDFLFPENFFNEYRQEDSNQGLEKTK